MAALHTAPSRQAIQWDGDNLLELEFALDDFVVNLSAAGGVLRIIGMGGLDLTLQLGDTLLIEKDRLGIVRPASKPKSKVIWTGSNLEEFAAFLKHHKVRLAVAGEALLIHGGTRPLILSRGDRLIERNGQIVVSIKGKDHADG